MALAFFLVIRLLGCQLWSTSGFSPVGSGIAGSEQGDERRRLRLGWGRTMLLVDIIWTLWVCQGWWPVWQQSFLQWALLGRVFLAGCMACLLCLLLLFPFCMRNCNCCLQISVGRFLPCGVCGKQIHCFCIFITDIIFVEKGKGVCVYGEEHEITWSPYDTANMFCITRTVFS